MRKWKLLLAGMMLMLSLSAVAGCGNNNANDKNNGTNGTNTSTENRLNNNADTTTGNDKNNIDTTEDKDNNRVDDNGNVIDDVLDGVVQAKIDEFNEEYNGEMDKVLMRFIEYSIIHRKVWANLFDARGREWLEKYVKTRIHYLALLQIRKMSEGYILSIKDVEIICSFYEEAIFGLLIRWIIKEEKTKTVDEIKDTVERIEKLFEGQLDLIISNMKK